MELKLADGYILTTERAESSYGQPVLVAPNGVALGQNDRAPEISGDELGWLYAMYTARQIVAGMICVGARCEVDANHPLVIKFLGYRSPTGGECAEYRQR